MIKMSITVTRKKYRLWKRVHNQTRQIRYLLLELLSVPIPILFFDVRDSRLHFRLFTDEAQQENTPLAKGNHEDPGLDDRNMADLALRGIFHALRDRLTPEEAARFSAELSTGFVTGGLSEKPIEMDWKI